MTNALALRSKSSASQQNQAPQRGRQPQRSDAGAKPITSPSMRSTSSDSFILVVIDEGTAASAKSREPSEDSFHSSMESQGPSTPNSESPLGVALRSPSPVRPRADEKCLAVPAMPNMTEAAEPELPPEAKAYLTQKDFGGLAGYVFMRVGMGTPLYHRLQKAIVDGYLEQGKLDALAKFCSHIPVSSPQLERALKAVVDGYVKQGNLDGLSDFSLHIPFSSPQYDVAKNAVRGR